MSSDFTDIDKFMLLLFELDIISEEVCDAVLDNSNFWWPTREQAKIYHRY